MRFGALVFIYVWLPYAYAGDYAQELLRARSAAEVRKATNDFEALAVARLACRMQLKKASIPSACYEVLRIETSRGVHSRAAQTRLLAKLDEFCERAAGQLSSAADRAQISPRCRRYVQSADLIREYREKGPGWSEN